MKLLFSWLINAVAVYATAYFLDTIYIENFTAALIVALVLGLINTLLKPILVFFSMPFIVVTLGLFLLIINAGMLYLASYFVTGFALTGFWAAFFGSIIISVISWVLSSIFGVK
jgi:putative membrane protein